jgi:hypothetical protein
VDATPERWLPVVGYEGFYEVSDQGRVRSLDRIVDELRGGRTWKGRVLITQRHPKGYLIVALTAKGRSKSHSVHRLVLRAFQGDCPDGMQCCHANGIRDDNRLDNLRWDTRSANEQDKIRHGTHPQLSKTHCPKGHPYDETNTYRSKGTRKCRRCVLERMQQRSRAAI